MATRNLQQLSKSVMEKLAILDAYASPSAVDHRMIVDRYLELLEGLREENLCYWEDAEIPLLVFPAVTDLVALHSASAFGLGVSPSEIEGAEVPIKRRIRRHTREQASNVETAENF